MRANNWTVINILKGKTILFTILTIILTKIFYELANKGLNVYLNQFNDHPIYTHNYSLGKTGLLLIIPAAIVTIVILKLYSKLRNMPYRNEFDLSPTSLKKKKNTIVTFFSNKTTQYVLLYGFVLIGSYISIMLVISFVQMMVVLFPSIVGSLFRFGFPILGFIIGIYIWSIFSMFNVAKNKYPILASSKSSARLGLLSLIFLLIGIGFIFSLPGIICSITGFINDKGVGRQTAFFGFVSSFITLLINTGIAYFVYLYASGTISMIYNEIL